MEPKALRVFEVHESTAKAKLAEELRASLKRFEGATVGEKSMSEIYEELRGSLAEFSKMILGEDADRRASFIDRLADSVACVSRSREVDVVMCSMKTRAASEFLPVVELPPTTFWRKRLEHVLIDDVTIDSFAHFSRVVAPPEKLAQLTGSTTSRGTEIESSAPRLRRSRASSHRSVAATTTRTIVRRTSDRSADRATRHDGGLWSRSPDSIRTSDIGST